MEDYFGRGFAYFVLLVVKIVSLFTEHRCPPQCSIHSNLSRLLLHHINIEPSDENEVLGSLKTTKIKATAESEGASSRTVEYSPWVLSEAKTAFIVSALCSCSISRLLKSQSNGPDYHEDNSQHSFQKIPSKLFLTKLFWNSISLSNSDFCETTQPIPNCLQPWLVHNFNKLIKTQN